MSLLKLPYTNLHELNLDWIIEQLNKEGAVISVNDKHGIVTLTAEDINRTPNNPQTVEQALTSQGSSIQAVRTEIGVTPLPTAAQSITGAIAEHETDITDINTEIGTTPLPTTAQTLTGAIAENAGEIADIQDNAIGATPLPTTAQTLTGAIAEVDGDISGINNKIGTTPLPTTAQTLTGAIAEHETDITTLNGNFTKTSVLISEQSGIAFCVAYKKAGWVTVIGHSAGQRQLDGSGSFQPFETLPEGYRPAEVQYGVGCTASGVGIAFEISTNGLIQYLTPSNTTYWYYSFSFPVA